MPNRPVLYAVLACLTVGGTVFGGAVAARAADADAQARHLIETANFRGGLIVHVGCGDGRLTAALGVSDASLVHGLARDEEAAAKARAAVRQAGRYGRVSIGTFDGTHLPYVDGLVNLLIADDLGGVPMDEVRRVLAPGGTALIAGKKTVKPRPDAIDDWTHYLHGPDNNAVAEDTMVGPPRHIQWISGPRFGRSHDHLAGVSAVVSAGGRIFSIVDEGSIAFVAASPDWRLVARDAFSGVRLWDRHIEPWEYHLRDFRSGPADLARRLVAVGDRVYVTLGYGRPVTALDAATGETVRTYAGTDGAREIVCADGTLYLVLGEPHVDWPAKTAKETVTQKDYTPPFERYVPPPHRLRVMAVDAAGGKTLWTRDETDTRDLLPSTLAVSGGRVCFQNAEAVVCLDAATGKREWTAPRPAQRRRLAWSTPTLVVHDGVVYSADRRAAQTAGDLLWIPSGGYHEYIRGPDARGELIAFDAATGKELWRCPAYEGFNAPVDVLIADGLLWTGRYAWGGDPGVTEARDPKTGEVRRRRESDLELLGRIGHARCHRAKATSAYLVLGRRGIEFVDLDTGRMTANFWVRGICQYGVLPANGLVYVPPHACACSVDDMLKIGYAALAPERAEPAAPAPDPATIEPVRGPAYAAIKERKSGIANAADWPTYRHDAARSGIAGVGVPSALDVAWTTDLGGPLTSPVVAGGLLVVAGKDAHAVHALDAATGRRVWRFTAGGRIDSPPTVAAGRAIFGSADGWVYCLRLEDGALAWKRPAAPRDRRIVVEGQLESPWPVHGSVLVRDGAVYFAAGRTTYLDGGMWLFKVDAATGRTMDVVHLEADPKKRDSGVASGGHLPDVLSSRGDSVFMRSARFDLDLGRRRGDAAHLWSSVGFLDDSWWHRTYWQYGSTMKSGWGGWAKVGQKVPAGRLLVTDGSRVFGYGRNQYDIPGAHVGVDAAGVWGPVGRRQDRWTWYRLFGGPVEAAGSKGKETPNGGAWSRRVPVLVRGMVLAGEVLFAAGAPVEGDEVAHDPTEVDPLARALASTRDGRVLAVSARDGTTLAARTLPAPPVFDGLIAARGRLYVSAADGTVVCLAEKE
jgi:outer membrane protein assembly factor BamB